MFLDRIFQEQYYYSKGFIVFVCFFVAVCVFSPIFPAHLSSRHTPPYCPNGEVMFSFSCSNQQHAFNLYRHIVHIQFMVISSKCFTLKKKSYISWDISCLLHLFLNFPTHLFILIQLLYDFLQLVASVHVCWLNEKCLYQLSTALSLLKHLKSVFK